MISANTTQSEEWEKAYSGRRVLLTGHTGFVGSWMSSWLRELGADVYGYAAAPDPGQMPLHQAIEPERVFAESVIGEIADFAHLVDVTERVRPDIVLHLAAQALVRPSYESPRETFETNVMGTVNVLEAVRRSPETRACLVVTSDKCYENVDQIWPYRENDAMGGRDPYSASKGAAEIVTSSYARSFFVTDDDPVCSSARAGNIIGGGDFSTDRLIPDVIRAIQQSEPMIVRNPNATRPWQHVLESVNGYLRLGAAMMEHGQAFTGGWNFGPETGTTLTVMEVVDLVSELFGDAWPGVSVEPDSGPHEAQKLNLDTTKAQTYLGWRPVLDVPTRVRLTFEWYHTFLTKSDDVASLIRSQITDFRHTMHGSQP